VGREKEGNQKKEVNYIKKGEERREKENRY
jgi:hypothetical protein